jgi:YfiR/HmsC-like
LDITGSTMRQHRNRILKIIKGCLLLLASLFVVIQPTVRTYARASLEYHVKAAFLYNFTKFVKWPEKAFPNAASPIKICILGDSPFGSSLDAIENKTAGGRKLVIFEAKSVNDIDDCHVLFISNGSEEEFLSSIERVQEKNILTVGDKQSLARKGSVINFIVVNNKVRFEINAKSAERANLKISSQLLKIARIVEDE